MIRILATIVLVLTSLPAYAQTAFYEGRSYTPESFPRGTWCNCGNGVGMCHQLRTQWRAQGWVSGYGSSKVMNQSTLDGRGFPAVQSVTPGPQGASVVKSAYRQVTKYRTETYQVKRCVNGRCFYQTMTRQVPYQAWEAVAVPKASPAKPAPVVKDSFTTDLTSPEVAKAVLKLISPTKDDTVVDLGCGDGALLAAAVPYGCRLVGVESSQERADKAAWRLPSAKIVKGDILEQRDEHGTIYLAYLFPDLIRDAAKLLPAGAMLVSIDHPVPGLDLYEHEFEVAGQPHAIYTGVIQ